jgi:formyl-CoA transferase
MSHAVAPDGILSGIRVIDLAHQYSAANTAAILADLGAEVIAIEHPEGSPIRTMLPKKDGESMWWKICQRGKKNITLNLSTPAGRDLLLRLASDADVLVENFRPGTLERWGLGPDDLEKAGANLAMLRISGFGQTGPNRALPGFGTVAEAMSGFAHMNGYPDGPPTFPSTTLADGVASVWGVVGVLAALVGRLMGRSQGVEVADVALFEGLFRIIPTQIPTYHQTGKAQRRPGNYLGDHGVLRNVYGSKDHRYLAISSVGPQAIRRILVGAGAGELVEIIDGGVMNSHDTATVEHFLGRCNEHLRVWAAARNYDELTADLSAAGAVYAPVFSAAEIVQDAHYHARDDLPLVPDKELGPIMMQGIVPKFPRRTHRITHAGQAKGSDNVTVFGGLGLSEGEIAALREQGVI